MNNEYQFSGNEIYNMNCKYPWNGSIKSYDSYKNQSTYSLRNQNKPNAYKLHATGHCDATNGRTYIYLPSDLVITSEIKKKYNLL
tara:strand:+ start:5005 stop:5259 length:255 start_codon:yes stop_codon:yes gene_type:complete